MIAAIIGAIATGLLTQSASAQSNCSVAGELGRLGWSERADATGRWARGDCLTSVASSRRYTDFYSFDLQTQTRLIVELTSNDLKPVLFLADAAKEAIEGAIVDGDRVARISWTLGRGTWHVAATKRGTGEANYRLRILGSKSALAEVLFGPNAGPTLGDYNDYGATRGYSSGHAGWDVQTQSVAPELDGNRLVNVSFYSLTAGEVIEVGVDSTGNTIIAVYDSAERKTTLYYHARRIEVYEGARVEVGTRLGLQGMAGNATGVHVHVELRSGRRMRGAAGSSGSIDPIADSYLFDSIAAAWPVSTSVVPEIAKLESTDRIRMTGAQDQYMVQQSGQRRFKRLILTAAVLDMYKWRTPQEIEVSQGVLDAIPTSTLVWVVDSDGEVREGARVWHLRPNPDGETGTKHHVTAAVFAQAGLEWDSVFKMNSAEAALWDEGAPLTPADAPQLRRAQGFRDLID